MKRIIARREMLPVVQKAEPPKFTRWQRFKTAFDAINHFKSPGTAVAIEGLMRGAGTPEERQMMREKLVRKGVFEAVETVALEKVKRGTGPYRRAPIGVDTVGELATLKEIAEEGILKRKEIIDDVIYAVDIGARSVERVAAMIGAFTAICSVVAVVGAGAVGAVVAGAVVDGVAVTIGAVVAGIVTGIVTGVVVNKLDTRAEKIKKEETAQLAEAMKKAQQLLTQ